MNNNLKKLILAALFAALSCVATMSIRIPTPGTGGYIHPGDAIVILSGVILGPVWGFFAGGIGSALSDLIGGYFVSSLQLLLSATWSEKFPSRAYRWALLQSFWLHWLPDICIRKSAKLRRAVTLQSFSAVLQTSSLLQVDISYVNTSSTVQVLLPASRQTSSRVSADLLFPASSIRS